MSIGLDRDNEERIFAGLDFALLQTAQAGHCCVPDEMLVREAAKLLGVDRATVAAGLSAMIKQNRLLVEDIGQTLIYPEYLYYAEREVAERLLRLKKLAKPLRGGDCQAAVASWETAAGLKLAATQREAVAAAGEQGILVLTGGPGTGKTTVVKGIMAVLEAAGAKIMLGAPTGRAAKRLSETTGREAATVHRLLEAGGGPDGGSRFGRDEDNQLDADVIIIDEASMMDIALMHYFLRAVPDGCRVVLVGDVDQLPAVGPGAVLQDIIRSQTVAVVRLTEVFRQAEESIIIRNAHLINRGRLPDCHSSADFQFRETASDQATAEAIVQLCHEELTAAGFDPLREVQVLSPMHRLPCGVENLNRLLQLAFNPPAAGRENIPGFRRGDKVMQIRNNYQKGVFNGDIGFIVDAEPARLLVRYQDDNDIKYERGEFNELQLAYAMSVHKSQGSEYPVVVLPLVPGHGIMLQRNLLYTAVTRARIKVILLGSRAALNTAVGNDRQRRRYSLLAERLRGEGLW